MRRSVSAVPGRQRPSATTAISAKPRPQATSTTLCRPTRSADRRRCHQQAAALTAAAPGSPAASERSASTARLTLAAPDGEDLVDAHPALLERQRAAGQVEPPDPGRLLADQRDDLVPARSRLASQARMVRT